MTSSQRQNLHTAPSGKLVVVVRDGQFDVSQYRAYALPKFSVIDHGHNYDDQEYLIPTSNAQIAGKYQSIDVEQEQVDAMKDNIVKQNPDRIWIRLPSQKQDQHDHESRIIVAPIKLLHPSESTTIPEYFYEIHVIAIDVDADKLLCRSTIELTLLNGLRHRLINSIQIYSDQAKFRVAPSKLLDKRMLRQISFHLFAKKNTKNIRLCQLQAEWKSGHLRMPHVVLTVPDDDKLQTNINMIMANKRSFNFMIEAKFSDPDFQGRKDAVTVFKKVLDWSKDTYQP